MERWYPPSAPIAVQDGIKAHSKTGAFGRKWWAKRWIEVLESFDIGARLQRGRSYARRGQVLDIEIEKGAVTARVQGSRPRPYDISIAVKTLSTGGWRKLARALEHQAIFSAKLLGGEMPDQIEQAFTQAGLSLFPSRLRDLWTQCSCPDSSNPCKHIAAVCYLLGEEFDRDPFLLFKLRGMERGEFISLISPARGKKRAVPADPEEPPTSEALPADPARFWHGTPLPPDLFGEVRLPAVNAALPKRLGAFPFWRGAVHFFDALEPLYESAAKQGLSLFVCVIDDAASRPSSVPKPETGDGRRYNRYRGT